MDASIQYGFGVSYDHASLQMCKRSPWLSHNLDVAAAKCFSHIDSMFRFVRISQIFICRAKMHISSCKNCRSAPELIFLKCWFDAHKFRVYRPSRRVYWPLTRPSAHARHHRVERCWMSAIFFYFETLKCRPSFRSLQHWALVNSQSTWIVDLAGSLDIGICISVQVSSAVWFEIKSFKVRTHASVEPDWRFLADMVASQLHQGEAAQCMHR